MKTTFPHTRAVTRKVAYNLVGGRCLLTVLTLNSHVYARVTRHARLKLDQTLWNINILLTICFSLLSSAALSRSISLVVRFNCLSVFCICSTEIVRIHYFKVKLLLDFILDMTPWSHCYFLDSAHIMVPTFSGCQISLLFQISFYFCVYFFPRNSQKKTFRFSLCRIHVNVSMYYPVYKLIRGN